MTSYSSEARAAIEQLYADPRLERLADRVEELLDLLDEDPGDRRVRTRRMQKPALWVAAAHGDGRDFMLLWDIAEDGEPFVRYAGDGL